VWCIGSALARHFRRVTFNFRSAGAAEAGVSVAAQLNSQTIIHNARLRRRRPLLLLLRLRLPESIHHEPFSNWPSMLRASHMLPFMTLEELQACAVTASFCKCAFVHLYCRYGIFIQPADGYNTEIMIQI